MSRAADIGRCKSLAVTCVSEVGWWDTAVALSDLEKGGGPEVSQWRTSWTPENAAGSCSLVDVEGLDGEHTKFLIDAGWDATYMEERLAKLGIDRMLQDGDIKFLYMTHEHLDHLWGIEAVLKHNPDIKIIVPSTFKPEAYDLIRGAEFMVPHAKNTVHHTGELVKLSPGVTHTLMPGCASVTFDVPIILGVRGEQSLYFNVKDKGVAAVTGCCHQNVLTLAEYARENLSGGEDLYALYGGLHIAPFGPLTPAQEEWITGMKAFGFRKIAANHCTGLPAVQKMIELGYPVIKGTGSQGSMSDLYVGNGDSATF